MASALSRRLSSESGLGILEVLVAMVVLAFAIAGLLGVFAASSLSLARAGHKGTATVVADSVMEYYRRAPWDAIRLIPHGRNDGYSTNAGTPFGTDGLNIGGYVDVKSVTDTLYASQCPNSCSLTIPPGPANASTVTVDNDVNTNCGYMSYGSGDVRFPPTRCLAIADVVGADGLSYRVWTYMSYGCPAASAGSCGGTAETNTKVVTLIVRLVRSDGTVDNSSSGLLYETTQVFNIQYYTTAIQNTSTTPSS